MMQRCESPACKQFTAFASTLVEKLHISTTKPLTNPLWSFSFDLPIRLYSLALLAPVANLELLGQPTRVTS